jgi:hypothetical protein
LPQIILFSLKDLVSCALKDFNTMVGFFNKIWTAFLKVFGIATHNTVTRSENDGPVSVDQPQENRNWRGAPGEYSLLAISTIYMLPEPLD